MSDSSSVASTTYPLILSVDDDSVNQTVIEFLLEGNGYRVVQAMDGIEALEYLKSPSNEFPALILLDVMMPHMSGYEVCERIRKLYPPQVPVIMISAKCSREDIVHGLKCRCNDYVTKPFDKEELLARIDSMLKLNALRDQQEQAQCATALQKVALPKTSLTAELIENTAKVCVLSALGEEMDSIRPFLDFLAGKFGFVPIPNLLGDFLAVSTEPVPLTAALVQAVTEYCGMNSRPRLTFFNAIGKCKAVNFPATPSASPLIVPRLFLFGPVLEELNQLIAVDISEPDVTLVCGASVPDLSIFEDFRVVSKSDKSAHLAQVDLRHQPVQPAPTSRRKVELIRGICQLAPLVNRGVVDLERVAGLHSILPDSCIVRNTSVSQSDFVSRVETMLKRYCDADNGYMGASLDWDTLLQELKNRFDQPHGTAGGSSCMNEEMNLIDEAIQVLELEKRELEDSLVHAGFGVGVKKWRDLEESKTFLLTTCKQLEHEYKALSDEVNGALQKVLQVESINESLFLESNRRQFEARLPRKPVPIAGDADLLARLAGSRTRGVARDGLGDIVRSAAATTTVLEDVGET